MDIYYCRPCQQTHHYSEFIVTTHPNYKYQQIQCLITDKMTLNIKCHACAEYSLWNSQQATQILDCKCGIKCRYYQCDTCKDYRTTYSSTLQQSSRIRCKCQTEQYIVNCPFCTYQLRMNNLNDVDQCPQCQQPFTINRCCGQDVYNYSTYNNQSVQTFNCHKGHTLHVVKCPECQHDNHIKSQSDSEYYSRCTECKSKLLLVQCLCKQSQVVDKQDDEQCINVCCQNCNKSQYIYDCPHCDGYLSINHNWYRQADIDKSNKPTPVYYSTCHSCNVPQMIVLCIKCDTQEIMDVNSNQKCCSQCKESYVHDKNDNTIICTICQDTQADQVLIPCGHITACLDCSRKLNNKCPICKKPIQSVHRIYISGAQQ